MKIIDMPKLKSPFVRKEIDGVYQVTPEIEEGYEWVFEGGTEQFVEGIVFTHPDGRMATLRRDMFDWYEGRRHNGGKKNED